MRSAGTILVVLLATAGMAGAATYNQDVVVVVDDREQVFEAGLDEVEEPAQDLEPLEPDAVSGSLFEPRPPPADRPAAPTRVHRGGDRMHLEWDDACFELRMVRDYDGREILTMTFAHDGRCGQPPQEGKPAATP